MTQSRLPRWNLKQYYDSPDDPQIDKDIASYARFCREFKKRYEGKMASLSDEALVQAIDRYHSRIDQGMKLGNYAFLSHERDQNDTKIENLYHKIGEKVGAADEQTEFFSHEMISLPKDCIAQFKRNPDIDRKYKFYVEYLASGKPHLLSQPEERLYDKLVPLIGEMDSLYDQINTDQKFRLGKRSLDYSAMRDKINYSADPKVREKAFKQFVKTIAVHRTAYETIIDTGIKFREEAHKIGHFNRPTSMWNDGNDIDDDDLPLKMAASIKNSGLPERFNRIKAKLMGKTQLNPWDLNAPLPDDTRKRYSWEDARNIIIAAFTHFHPELGATAKRAFTDRWIDAAPAEGKDPSVGFCVDGSEKYHPHVLINWHGSMDDLITLAHEVGHAVAMDTQTKHQGNMFGGSGMLIAELTALFAERMVYNELENRARTPKEKRMAKYHLINSHESHYLQRAYEYAASVDLQKSYKKNNRYHFDAATLDEWWLNIMKDSYGDSVRNIELMAPMWAARGHLFSEPFYLGDYPMSCLISQVLFDKYRSGEIDDLPDRFMDMLKKGSTDYTLKLVKGLGVDVQEKGFWRKGVNCISRDMDELEQLMEDEKTAGRGGHVPFAERVGTADQRVVHRGTAA